MHCSYHFTLKKRQLPPASFLLCGRLEYFFTFLASALCSSMISIKQEPRARKIASNILSDQTPLLCPARN